MTLPRLAALGTMHGKEAAIGPPLSRLGISLVVPGGLDTDRFGTFAGDRPRTGTMEEAARAKARAAAQATGLETALASEGAYGPHPSIPVVAAGLELLLWRNETTGHEVIERLADESPVHDQVLVSSMGEAEAFLSKLGFPDTAMIVSPGSCRSLPVGKGLRNADSVARAIAEAARASSCGRAFLQTDMRAHVNPRRMAIIARLADRMAERLARTCAACGAPGWGLLNAEKGLPCGWCGGPTQLVAHEVHGCTACGARDSVPRADGRTEADPGACPSCNP